MSPRRHPVARAWRGIGFLALLVTGFLLTRTALGADTVTVGGLSYVNKGLIGVGRLPADLRDKFGETFGSGSGLALDAKSWTRTPAGYQGTFYMLPDRGYNIGGTTDYRARLNKLAITFKPLADPAAAPVAERQKSVAATLTDTILLTDAGEESLTGLDPEENGIRRAAKGFPDLPQASNGRVSIDAESLALLPDGGFFIGDEYGPYVYRFSATGRLLAAIRPPEAFIPQRKGRDHFSSNNPGPGATARTQAIRKAGGRTIRASRAWRRRRTAGSWWRRCRARPARTAVPRRRRGNTRDSSTTMSPISTCPS